MQEAEQEDEEMSEKELTKEGLVYLRKVLVTPLRVLPYPETIEESNRIIRQCVPFIPTPLPTLKNRYPRVSYSGDGIL